MPETTRSSGAADRRELTAVLTGFDVVDPNGDQVGTVKKVNLQRTCIIVEGGRSLFGRKRHHAVHMWAVRDIDMDAFIVLLSVSKGDVAKAPELHQLDTESETAVARYYYERLAALGETVDADAPQNS